MSGHDYVGEALARDEALRAKLKKLDLSTSFLDAPSPKSESDYGTTKTVPTNGAERPSDEHGKPAWLDDCLRGEKGVPYPNLANALIALRGDPHFDGLLAYDEMMQAPLLMRSFLNVTVPSPRPVTDDNVTRVQNYLQHAGLRNIGREAVFQAVTATAHDHAFHPVRKYLTGLKWDGKARIDSWLTSYLGVPPSRYVDAVGRMFLIAMVARIMRPGCKADYMLVLEGPQGELKSTACAALGGDWFSDNLPEIGEGKDVLQHLRGKWLIEIAEMHAMNRTDTAKLKAFITSNTDRYRPSYRRMEVIQPRQCTFIGTTNKDTYLKDETGGRRFWPVRIGTIDVAALKADRDMLFAEAAHQFEQGEQWWPERKFEREVIAPEQEERFEADAWEEPISKYLESRDRVTVGEIAKECLFLDTGKISQPDQMRIKSAMTHIGWEKGNRGHGGIRYWQRRKRR